MKAGVSVSELARKQNIHPSLPCRWEKEYHEDPDARNAFSDLKVMQGEYSALH